MYEDLFYTFLISLSPVGEARLGIPFAIAHDIRPIPAFIAGFLGNFLVYPLLTFLIDVFNKRLWKNRLYKKHSLKIMRRAKKGVGKEIDKYGFWGIMVFVMVPLPFTGAYMGTIAAHLFNINRKKAFLAVSIGTLISCLLMAFGSHFGKMGLELL